MALTYTSTTEGAKPPKLFMRRITIYQTILRKLHILIIIFPVMALTACDANLNTNTSTSVTYFGSTNQSCATTTDSLNTYVGFGTRVSTSCADKKFTISGQVIGNSEPVTVTNNGSQATPIGTTGGVFNFTSQVFGTSYSVTLDAIPSGQSCLISNGSGIVVGTINNIIVTCTNGTYTVGGSVSGNTGSITLLNNATERLTIIGNGNFSFPAQNYGENYSVIILSQPIGQTCQITNGNGSHLINNVDTVMVNCTTNVYSVSGTVSGHTGIVAVLNNGTNSQAIVPSSNQFEFAPQNYGSGYIITLGAQPIGQSCQVTNGFGTIIGTVTNVLIICSTNLYTISGTNNTGAIVSISGTELANSTSSASTFVFTAKYADVITLAATKAGSTCAVNGTITNPLAANVTNLSVVCTLNTYNIAISNPNNSTVIISGSTAFNTSPNTETSFNFIAKYGDTVTVSASKPNYTCTVTPTTFRSITANSSTTVNCSPNTFTVSGRVMGNTESVTLTNNGADSQIVATGGGPFTFTAQSYDSTYLVDTSQPHGQTCLIQNPSGTIKNIVTDVIVECSTNLVPPVAPTPSVSFSKNPNEIILDWPAVTGATSYTISKDPTGTGSYSTICQSNIPSATRCIDTYTKLTDFIIATYKVSACNLAGCTPSNAIAAFTKEDIQYIKASNTGTDDTFSRDVALSADGNTLAVGANQEDSSTTGINNGNQLDNSATDSGAVYVYTRTSDNKWTQQAYIKASNTDAGDNFGWRVALSDDGNTLAVSAIGEASNATGINGNEFNNSAINSGAVYIYTRSGSNWNEQAYIKASNTEANDNFGKNVALSGDGGTLAVGADGEASKATGINGIESDNTAPNSGAVYIYTRSGSNWNKQAYIKASNTETGDAFGWRVALSKDGSTLAVGAYLESSATTVINGNQLDNSATGSGAVYIFTRNNLTWTQQAYIKPSNTSTGDNFGWRVSLSGNGKTLAVGAIGEDSSATGINNNQSDNSAANSGAVYLYTFNGLAWNQQAYIKAFNTSSNDQFGIHVVLSEDGNTLVAGAIGESSNATGVNGDQYNNSAANSGAVYLYTFNGSTWTQHAYIKASNTNSGDLFGRFVALSADGSTLAVSGLNEDSNATGINGDQTNNSATNSGAVYIY